jgi:hypothetical protein
MPFGPSAVALDGKVALVTGAARGWPGSVPTWRAATGTR